MNKLYQDIDSKKYTDVELILIDYTNNSINLNVHKCILAYSSEYFDKLFNFGLERDKQQIVITVNDVFIAKDIIYSFYGHKQRSTDYPDWKYLLLKLECRDFFMLDNNISKLHDIYIPNEAFDDFINVIHFSNINEDNNLIAFIKNNMPIDFDLSKLPIQIIDKLIEHKNFNIITACYDGTVNILNGETGKFIKYLNSAWKNEKAYNVLYDKYNRNIIYSIECGDIIIKNISTNNKCILHGNTFFVNKILLHPYDDKLISTTIDCINIWNINTCEKINTCIKINSMNEDCVDIPYSIAISHDGQYFASVYNEEIIIWNFNGDLLHKIPVVLFITNIVFSKDNHLIFGTGNYIKIYDINSAVYNEIATTCKITCVAICINNDIIATGHINGSIVLWNINSHKVICIFYTAYKSDIKNIIFSPYNDKIIVAIKKVLIVYNIISGKLLYTLDKFGSIKHISYSNITPNDHEINQRLISYRDSILLHNKN